MCSLRLSKMTVAAYINSECVLKVNNYGILPQPPECQHWAISQKIYIIYKFIKRCFTILLFKLF